MEDHQRPRRRRRTKASARCARCLANPQDRKYVTMWNTITCRKIAGTAAPCQDELQEYLARHSHVQVYTDQDGGPEAIKQRRKDRNKEKERRKRERKKTSNDVDAGNLDARTNPEKSDCLGNSEMVTAHSGQKKDERLDHGAGLVRGEIQSLKMKEEAGEVLEIPSVRLEKLEGGTGKDIGEGYTVGVSSDHIFNVGHIHEDGQPSVLIDSFPEKQVESTEAMKDSDPITKDKLELQVEAGLPSSINQDSDPQIRSKLPCMKKLADFEVNKGGRKRKRPLPVCPFQRDVIFIQRVWTAEAYAAIAERRKKRKREESMQEEDEEIREFRELMRRTY